MLGHSMRLNDVARGLRHPAISLTLQARASAPEGVRLPHHRPGSKSERGLLRVTAQAASNGLLGSQTNGSGHRQGMQGSGLASMTSVVGQDEGLDSGFADRWFFFVKSTASPFDLDPSFFAKDPRSRVAHTCL